MSMNMIKNDFKFNPYVKLTRLAEEETEQYTKRKHKDNNASKSTKTPTGSIQQEYLENASIYMHKTTIVHTTTTIVHTSWQSLVQKFGINVEDTNAAEVNIEQETRIRTMSQSDIFSNNIENFNGNEYICKICHASFDHFDEFLVHKNFTHKSEPYVCNVCDARFTLRAHLNEHRAEHDNRPCMENSAVSLAETLSSSEIASDNHHAIRNNVSNNSSKLHQQITRRQLTLDKKKVKNQKENSSAVNSEEYFPPNIRDVNRSYKCKDCNIDFTTRIELNIHYNQHTQKLICDSCHKTFVLKRNFEKHLLSHTNVTMSNDISNNTNTFEKQQEVIGSVKRKSNTLNVPTKTIKRTDDKSVKQNISLNEKSFQCLYCKKYCKSKHSLGQHKRQNHSRTELPDQNLKSGTAVIKKTYEKSVKQKISLNEKSFQCLYCKKYCKSKHSLGQHKRQNHSRTESPDQNLKSEIVVIKKIDEKSVTQKISLNEKLFQCLYCKKYCKSKHSLGQHKRQNHSRTESPDGKVKSGTVLSK